MCHNRLQIEESSKPARLSQQLQSPVTNYKPVANHSYNVRNLRITNHIPWTAVELLTDTQS